jgi:hypothetical protein
MRKHVSKIAPLISLLMSGSDIYLFKIYGSLVWWWRHLQRDGFFDGKTPPSFFAIADQIHVLAIVLSALNVCLAIMLWRTNIAHATLGVLAVVFAISVLAACLLVSI